MRFDLSCGTRATVCTNSIIIEYRGVCSSFAHDATILQSVKNILDSECKHWTLLLVRTLTPVNLTLAHNKLYMHVVRISSPINLYVMIHCDFTHGNNACKSFSMENCARFSKEPFSRECTHTILRIRTCLSLEVIIIN